MAIAALKHASALIPFSAEEMLMGMLFEAMIVALYLQIDGIRKATIF